MAIQRLSTRVQRSRVLQSADNAGPPLSQLIAHGPYQKPIPRLSPWAARSSLHEPNFSPSAFSSSCAALQSIPRRQFSYASARAAPGDDGYSPAGRGASLPTDDASPQANGTSSARRSRTDSTYSPPGPRQGPRGPPQIPGLEGSWKRATLLRWFARKRSFAPGDVYTPTDLSARPLDAARPKPKRPTRDVLDVVGVDIVDEYKNPVMLAEFCTSMGRLRSRRETGLRPVNQRRLSKAIRRATGMGLMPTVHAHPELLTRESPWQWV